MAARADRRPQPLADNKAVKKKAAKIYSQSAADFKLIEEFPLTPVRDDEHLVAAIDVMRLS